MLFFSPVQPPKRNSLYLAFKLCILLGIVALIGAGCKRPDHPRNLPPIVVWGVFDESETMRPFIQAFSKEVRGARVEYKKISPVDQYEQRLLRALAENRGPDVFLIHNSWIPHWKNTLLPAPQELVSEKQVREEFVDTVADDLTVGGRVLALPLFVDSLALYYNKDIFNAAGVARPPKTWKEVQEVVKRVTKFNEREPSQIDRHGITIGAGKNVNRASDILSILMMQNGAQMLDDDGMPAFGKNEDAVRALQFYTDFANPQKEVYTWNPRSDYSIDTFAEGEAAMMINYSYHMKTIHAKNPRLNFGVAPLPQIELGNEYNPPQTYASYWVLAVSQRTTAPVEAWKFITFMTKTDQSRAYLEKTGYPPARRDLVAELQNDPRIGVFASQSLIAKTWKQPDNRVVDRVFVEAIDSVVLGEETTENALRRAAEQIAAATKALRQLELTGGKLQ